MQAGGLAGSFAERGRRVGISSGQVYLVTASRSPPFREADADAPLMPEPAPGTRDHGEWAYGMGKRAVEAELEFQARTRGVPALALRLPVVQGGADSSHSRRLWAWIERLRDGGPVLLPEADAQRVRFVYAGDAAAALAALEERRGWSAFRVVPMTGSWRPAASAHGGCSSCRSGSVRRAPCSPDRAALDRSRSAAYPRRPPLGMARCARRFGFVPR